MIYGQMDGYNGDEPELAALQTAHYEAYWEARGNEDYDDDE